MQRWELLAARTAHKVPSISAACCCCCVAWDDRTCCFGDGTAKEGGRPLPDALVCCCVLPSRVAVLQIALEYRIQLKVESVLSGVCQCTML